MTEIDIIFSMTAFVAFWSANKLTLLIIWCSGSGKNKFFLADKHRLFGDLTVKFEPSHSPLLFKITWSDGAYGI